MYISDSMTDDDILALLRVNAVTPRIIQQKHVDAFKAIHYAINREKRYPSQTEQFDLQFHGRWEKAIAEIKLAWPKPTVRDMRYLQDIDFRDPRKLFPGSDTLNLMTAICYGKFSNTSNAVIVGSSCSLSGKKLGKQIDSYEKVVRVNWYPTTKKFIEDIGTRQDVVVIKSSAAKGRNSKLKLNKGRDAFHKSKMNPNEIWVANQASGVKLKGESLDYLRECYNTINHKAYGKLYKQFAGKHNIEGAFTGTQAIVITYLVTGKPVDIVGFCNTSYDKYRHYYDPESKSYDINHKQQKEESAIIYLMKIGVIGRILDIC